MQGETIAAQKVHAWLWEKGVIILPNSPDVILSIMGCAGQWQRISDWLLQMLLVLILIVSHFTSYWRKHAFGPSTSFFNTRIRKRKYHTICFTYKITECISNGFVLVLHIIRVLVCSRDAANISVAHEPHKPQTQLLQIQWQNYNFTHGLVRGWLWLIQGVHRPLQKISV